MKSKYLYEKYKRKYLKLKSIINITGGGLSEAIYNMIDIDELRSNYDTESQIIGKIVTELPIIDEDYLSSYKQISSTGQRNCGIYISENDPSKLIKCTNSSSEILYYLTIQKMVNLGKLPDNIIPKLYNIHKEYDEKKFYITMSREAGSISDYIFETYIPRKLTEKFGKGILNIYNLMLPRILLDRSLSYQLSNYDIPFLIFINFDEQELEYISKFLNYFDMKTNKSAYSLAEIANAVYENKMQNISKKINDGLITIYNTFNEVNKYGKKKQFEELFDDLKINKYILTENKLVTEVISLKNKLNNIQNMFSNLSENYNVYDYENFITYYLSKDLENKLRLIRYQIFLIDMYLLEVCGLYQGDRKYDNWLVEISKEPKQHLGIKSDQLNTKFDENEYVYVKIGDPEQMRFIKPEEIDRYKDMIGRHYFELGSKLGQYAFDLFGQKIINDFFFKYFEIYLGIDKSILNILSKDFRLRDLTDVNGRQIYDLLKTGIIL